MTRKHFKAIAEAIKTLDAPPEAKREFAAAMARVCRSTNPAFDWTKFMEACGV